MENLKAETEYVHANLPGVKTFVELGDIGTTARPDYMDFGLPGACSTASTGTGDLIDRQRAPARLHTAINRFRPATAAPNLGPSV
jgi:hypothetical protein